MVYGTFQDIRFPISGSLETAVSIEEFVSVAGNARALLQVSGCKLETN
jgi:hypothetical protein